MVSRAKDMEPGNQSGDAARDQRKQIENILQRIDALPVLDTRPAAEILDYDAWTIR